MNQFKKNIKIAIIQSGAVHLNLQESLQKAEHLIAEAAQSGAELLVFGETWLSGYPAWLDYCPEIAVWDSEATKEVFVEMYQNSISLDSKEMQKLCKLAQKHQVTLCIGANEKVEKGWGNGTIYNAFFIISNTGEILNHHRKLMPTYTEKMLYGLGDGYGLKAVDTPIGRVGGLICWEHWMPLTRQTMHLSNEHFHIALWPKVHELHQIASRQYAFEGRCFVIAVGQMLQVRDFPKALKLPDDLAKEPQKYVLNGGSCVIAPNGKYILEPQFDREGVIIQEITDLERIFKERMTLDVTGHYFRPDVFDFQVNRERKG